MKSSASNARAIGNPFPRRAVAWAVLLMLAATPLAAEEGDGFRRISSGYYPVESFQRISEFFTGRENPGRSVIVRTDPSQRSGYYLSLRLRQNPYRRQTVEDAVLLEVIPPGSVEAVSHRLSLGPVHRRNPEFLIGLTGGVWSEPGTRPRAWKVTFFDQDGEVIASRKSFLWGNPPDPSP